MGAGCFAGLDERELGCPALSACFEAESGTMVPKPFAFADPKASAGRFVQSTDTTVTTGESISWSFQAAKDGTHVVWTRVQTPNEGSKSFFYSMNGEAEAVDVASLIPYTQTPRYSDEWQWSLIGDYPANPRKFTLMAGPNQLTFRSREVGTAIDELIVTPDLAFMP
jgi:hypothetical protein